MERCEGNNNEHCWHRNIAGGHMIPWHFDTKCCHCGINRCFSVVSNHTVIHGKYYRHDWPVVEVQRPEMKWES